MTRYGREPLTGCHVFVKTTANLGQRYSDCFGGFSSQLMHRAVNNRDMSQQMSTLL